MLILHYIRIVKANNPYAAADIGIFRFVESQLQIYLVRLKTADMRGGLSLPGSLIAPDENLDQAARRIYYEATGNQGEYFEQVFTFSDPDRDERRRSISTAYMAFPKAAEQSFQFCDKYQGGGWYNAFQCSGLAYDHDKILEVCLERISAKLNYTTIALYLLPELFTLTDMQVLYEICLQRKLDKRNFRKKILSLQMIDATGQKRRGGRARPAMLYRATEKKMETIQLFK